MTLATTTLGIDGRFTDAEVCGVVDGAIPGRRARVTSSTPERLEVFAVTADSEIPRLALRVLQDALQDRQVATPPRSVTIRRENGSSATYVIAARAPGEREE